MQDTVKILEDFISRELIQIDTGALFSTSMVPKMPGFDYRRVEGMLLGAAIGDALGNTTEGMFPGERRKRFGEIREYLPDPVTGKEYGYPSDDTQLTFWTLDQLMEDGEFVPGHLTDRFASGGEIFGIGRTVREFIAHRKAGVPWYQCGPNSAGNGAIMRIAPMLIPHLKTGGTKVWADTAIAAMITHNDRASISACLAYIAMLYELMGMDGAPHAGWWKEQYVGCTNDLEGENSTYFTRNEVFFDFAGPLWRFIEYVIPWAAERKLSSLEACDAWYSGAYLLETVPSVLYILSKHAHDPQEAIVRAVNDTVDNDTIASLVGAAIGALYGPEAFPDTWTQRLTGRTSHNDDGTVQQLIAKSKQVFWDQQ